MLVSISLVIYKAEPALWNSFPLNIIMISKIDTFKKQLKNLLNIKTCFSGGNSETTILRCFLESAFEHF